MSDNQSQQPQVALDPAQIDLSSEHGNQGAHEPRPEGYSVADILLILIKSVRPAAVAAVLLFGASVLLQLTIFRVYASHATLQLDQSRAAILQSPELWAKVANDPGAIRLEVRRIPIIRNGVTTLGWYDVSGIGRSGTSAQVLLTKVIEALRDLTVPDRSEVERVDTRRQWLLSGRDSIRHVLDSALVALKDGTPPDAVSADMTEVISRLTDLIDNIDLRIAMLDESMAGFVNADIISPPSVPPDIPDVIWRNAVLGGLFGIFCVVTTLLMSDAYRRSQINLRA